MTAETLHPEERIGQQFITTLFGEIKYTGLDSQLSSLYIGTNNNGQFVVTDTSENVALQQINRHLTNESGTTTCDLSSLAINGTTINSPLPRLADVAPFEVLNDDFVTIHTMLPATGMEQAAVEEVHIKSDDLLPRFKGNYPVIFHFDHPGGLEEDYYALIIPRQSQPSQAYIIFFNPPKEEKGVTATSAALLADCLNKLVNGIASLRGGTEKILGALETRADFPKPELTPDSQSLKGKVRTLKRAKQQINGPTPVDEFRRQQGLNRQLVVQVTRVHALAQIWQEVSHQGATSDLIKYVKTSDEFGPGATQRLFLGKTLIPEGSQPEKRRRTKAPELFNLDDAKSITRLHKKYQGEGLTKHAVIIRVIEHLDAELTSRVSQNPQFHLLNETRQVINNYFLSLAKTLCHPKKETDTAGIYSVLKNFARNHPEFMPTITELAMKTVGKDSATWSQAWSLLDDVSFPDTFKVKVEGIQEHPRLAEFKDLADCLAADLRQIDRYVQQVIQRSDYFSFISDVAGLREMMPEALAYLNNLNENFYRYVNNSQVAQVKEDRKQALEKVASRVVKIFKGFNDHIFIPPNLIDALVPKEIITGARGDWWYSSSLPLSKHEVFEYIVENPIGLRKEPERIRRFLQLVTDTYQFTNGLFVFSDISLFSENPKIYLELGLVGCYQKFLQRTVSEAGRKLTKDEQVQLRFISERLIEFLQKAIPEEDYPAFIDENFPPGNPLSTILPQIEQLIKKKE